MKSADPVDAIILAGGEGTRLRPLTSRLPKPLLPVGNRPMLAQILHGLARYGVKHAALGTGYMAAKIRKTMGDVCDGVCLTHIVEKQPLGSGGALRNVIDQCSVAEDVWIAGADILHDVDVAAARQWHLAARERGALVTVIAGEVEDTTGFGICEADGEGRVGRFLEKPDAGVTTSRLANTALWIFSREALEMLPAGASSVERDLFPILAQRGALWVWAHQGYWLDCGTPERLIEANVAAIAGTFPTILDGDRVGDSLMGQGGTVGPNAALSGCTLSPGVSVGAGADLVNCVVLEDVHVGEGARLTRCIIERGTRVAPGTSTRDQILT